MNKHEICSQLLATLGVGLTLVAVPTMAAKPGGGIDESLCDTGLDFPAFTYRQLSGKDQIISVADASGKCSRVVYKSSSNAGSLGAGAFSYPVSGMSTNNVGRVVWPDGNAIWSIDFTVTGSSIQVGTKRKIYDGFLTSLDWSKDGEHSVRRRLRRRKCGPPGHQGGDHRHRLDDSHLRWHDRWKLLLQRRCR